MGDQGELRGTGKCNFSENGYEPSTVTAQLRGARLYYRFQGMRWNGPLNRCGSSDSPTVRPAKKDVKQ
jgi:hypothetical protein